MMELIHLRTTLGYKIKGFEILIHLQFTHDNKLEPLCPHQLTHFICMDKLTPCAYYYKYTPEQNIRILFIVLLTLC